MVNTPKNTIYPGRVWVNGVTDGVNRSNPDFDPRDFSVTHDHAGTHVSLNSVSQADSTPQQFEVRADPDYDFGESEPGYLKAVKVFPGFWERNEGNSPVTYSTADECPASMFSSVTPYADPAEWCTMGNITFLIDDGQTKWISAFIYGDNVRTMGLAIEADRHDMSDETTTDAYRRDRYVVLARVKNIQGTLTITQEHVGPIRQFFAVPDGNCLETTKKVKSINYTTAPDPADGNERDQLQDYRAREVLLDGSTVMADEYDKAISLFVANEGKTTITKMYARIDSHGYDRTESGRSIEVIEDRLQLHGFKACEPLYTITSNAPFETQYQLVARDAQDPDKPELCYLDAYSWIGAGVQEWMGEDAEPYIPLVTAVYCSQIVWDCSEPFINCSDVIWTETCMPASSIDWQNECGPISITAINSCGGTTALDIEAGNAWSIFKGDGTRVINLDNSELRIGDATTLDWADCEAYYEGNKSIDWASRELTRINGTTSLDWQSSELKDAAGDTALDFANRTLGASSGGAGWTAEAPLELAPGVASQVPLTITGAAGQTADLLQVMNSAGGLGFNVSASGACYAPNSMTIGDVTVGTQTALLVGGTQATDYAVSENGFGVRSVVVPTFSSASLALVAGGSALAVGTYYYSVTYVTAIGETELSNTGSMASIVTDAGHRKVQITLPISTDYRVTSRKIYRSTQAGGQYFRGLLATITDNTTATYEDNIADGSVGATTAYYKDNTTSILMRDGTSTIIALGVTTRVGRYAGNSTATGGRNTFVGYYASSSITNGSDDVIIGQASLASGNPTRVVAIGSYAMGTIFTAPTDSIALGYQSMMGAAGRTPSYSVGIGSFSLAYGAAQYSVAIGNSSGRYATTQNAYNVFLGADAGKGNSGGTSTVTASVAVGYSALRDITTGNYDVAVGVNSLLNCTTGYDNTAIGRHSGLGVFTQNNCVYLGAYSGYYSGGPSGEFILNGYDQGSRAADLSDSLLVGTLKQNNPAAQKLTVNGTLDARTYTVGGTPAVADGRYYFGSGSLLIKGGLIIGVQEDDSSSASSESSAST